MTECKGLHSRLAKLCKWLTDGVVEFNVGHRFEVTGSAEAKEVGIFANGIARATNHRADGGCISTN